MIARPFTGRPGSFRRTANRRDFTVEPSGETWLDRLVAGGRRVFAVGKIVDIFSGRGITESVHTGSDAEGLRVTSTALRTTAWDCRLHEPGRLRQQVRAPQRPGGLREERSRLWTPPSLSCSARSVRRTSSCVTADHGCETTDVSTDHTREFVPLLAAGPAIRPDVDLGVRQGFCDLAATAGEWLGVPAPRGESALSRAVG